MKTYFYTIRSFFVETSILITIGFVFTLCTSMCNIESDTEPINHIDILKTTGPYCQEPLKVNIHPIIDIARTTEIREYFQLDTLYDETASTWEKTLAIARFVATNIPHANQKIQPWHMNAIFLWEYTKNVEPAFNCRLHSIMMFELLSSIGIKATYITCMPKDSSDRDCHVVNQVWLPEIGKWVMIDSDSGGFYATDDEGHLLSLQEIRECYIHDKHICYHPQFEDMADEDSWYYDYMAKNTYWFSCWETPHFDQEPPEGEDVGRYIHLIPQRFKLFVNNDIEIVTNDDKQFWASPNE